MSGNFHFDTRPEVDVIVYRHRADCKFVFKRTKTAAAAAPSIFMCVSPVPASAPRRRSWETARQRAKEWADDHDPLNPAGAGAGKPGNCHHAQADRRSLRRVHRQQASRSPRTPDGYKATESKYGTMKKQLIDFRHVHDQGKPDAERVLHVHQVTSPLLNQWMGTWKYQNLLVQVEEARQHRSPSLIIASRRSGSR